VLQRVNGQLVQSHCAICQPIGTHRKHVRWTYIHFEEQCHSPPPEFLVHIAQSLNLPMRGLVTVIELLHDGGTVPFIARYRKEATGNLDEVQIRNIEERLAYFRDLTERRATILSSIAEQGKLTDHLKSRIEGTRDKSELEDLYLPYRPKRHGMFSYVSLEQRVPQDHPLWAFAS
jgi:protein Tex